MLTFLRRWGLIALLPVVVAWVWQLGVPPPDPTPDRTLETATARRARMQAAFDHEITLDTPGEPLPGLLSRLCQLAGVRANFFTPPRRTWVGQGDELELDFEPTDLSFLDTPDGTVALAEPLALPHPVRLRSALALVVPQAKWRLVTASAPVRPRRSPRGVSIRTYALQRRPRTEWWSLTWNLPHPDPHQPFGIELQFDFVGGKLADYLQPQRPRPAVTVGSDPHDHIGQILSALEHVAAGDLEGPVHIGETEAGRARRQLLEAALDRTIEVRLANMDLRQALDVIQAQLGVNIYLHARALEDEGIEVRYVGPLEGRLTARSALKHLLRPLELRLCIDQDVLLVTTAPAEPLSLRVYPVGHFLGRGYSRTSEALIETITSLAAPASWSEVGGRGDLALVEDGGALLVHQTDHAHRQIERLLRLMTDARDPTTRPTVASRACPWELRLAGPGLPLAGPLTLEELARRLSEHVGLCALIDLEAFDPPPEQTVSLAGDSGEGTLAEQLARMLKPGGCKAVVDYYVDDVLVLIPEKRGEGARVEFHVTPRITEPRGPAVRYHGPQFDANGNENLDREPGPAFPIGLIASAVAPTHFASSYYADLHEGLLANLSRADHARLRRLLTPGGPVDDLVQRYARASRRQRVPLLAAALESGSPDLMTLAIHLVDEDMLDALQPAIWAAFRSGLLLGDDRQVTSGVGYLWHWLAERHPPEELAAAVRELAARDSPDWAKAYLLTLACRHDHTAVCRAGLQGVAAMAARGCYRGDEGLLAFHARNPELRADAHAALALYVAHWASYLDGYPNHSFHPLRRVAEDYPPARELLQFYLAEGQSRIWYTKWIEENRELLVQMLADDQPEHRTWACQGLSFLSAPPPEVIARVELLVFDPLVSHVAENALARWKRPGQPADVWHVLEPR